MSTNDNHAIGMPSTRELIATIDRAKRLRRIPAAVRCHETLDENLETAVGEVERGREKPKTTVGEMRAVAPLFDQYHALMRVSGLTQDDVDELISISQMTDDEVEAARAGLNAALAAGGPQ
jgi:hypothetical protein